MNMAASGIAEEVTDTDKILDYLIHELDETDEEYRSDAKELRRKEQFLFNSGNQIRNMEISRQGKVANAMNAKQDEVVADVGHEVLDDIDEGTESLGRK